MTETVNCEAELRKYTKKKACLHNHYRLQSVFAQERVAMQQELKDSLVSLHEGLSSQLKALRMKTESLETRSVLSSLELNELQQRIKNRQNAPPLRHQNAPKTIAQRVRSARNTTKTDGDLSLWELGHTDYPYLFQQADSKCFVLLHCRY